MSVSEVMCRAIISWTVTIIILGGSFGAIYGLSLVQINYTGDNQLVISLAISLVILAINVALKVAIRIFTGLERAFTKTELNSSLAIKTTLAQLINAILVLVIVGYFIKDRNSDVTKRIGVFDQLGLIEDCFILALTTTLLPFVLSYFVDVELILNCFKKKYF